MYNARLQFIYSEYSPNRAKDLTRRVASLISVDYSKTAKSSYKSANARATVTESIYFNAIALKYLEKLS